MVAGDPAPLDPAEVARALAPFGSSRMLPRASYLDDAVLAWEREHLFGGWVCAGRSDDIPAGGMYAQSVGEYGVLLTRAAGGSSTATRTPAGTAATSCCRAA